MTPVTVNALNLTGMVTAPVKDTAPSAAPIDHAQYTGTIAWQDENGGEVSGNFAASTIYKAVVTLAAKSGFTFTGIAANVFSHNGASSVTNSANSGTVTITFPQTQTGGGQPAGNGTSSNPYRINTKADFMAIGGGLGTNGKYYRLEADLVGAESITEPIGNNVDKRFIGHFDGGGHTINLNITGNHKNAGLFAGIGGGLGTIPTGAEWFENAGTVQNLKLSGVITISGDDAYSAGAVAASIADAGSSIKGIASSVTVTVSGSSAVWAGGIVGSANSGASGTVVIEHCYSSGNVSITNPSGRVEAGGIAANFSTVTVSSCWA